MILTWMVNPYTLALLTGIWSVGGRGRVFSSSLSSSAIGVFLHRSLSLLDDPWYQCDAWRELVPAVDSGYATWQSTRFLNINKHLDLWNGFVSVLILGFLTPPPSLLCLHTQFQLFNFNQLILLFYYFRVRLQGFSKKKCV